MGTEPLLTACLPHACLDRLVPWRPRVSGVTLQGGAGSSSNDAEGVWRAAGRGEASCFLMALPIKGLPANPDPRGAVLRGLDFACGRMAREATHGCLGAHSLLPALQGDTVPTGLPRAIRLLLSLTLIGDRACAMAHGCAHRSGTCTGVCHTLTCQQGHTCPLVATCLSGVVRGQACGGSEGSSAR